jgi:DNA-binding transcriptional LysR family regulator
MRMTAFNDLSLLKAFVSIVESGSISAAARMLHLSQPTLSRQLSALEAKCGAVLLRRDTHRMSLTQTGHQLFADAQAMLALAEEAEQRLRGDQSRLAGNIRLFSTIDFGQSVVSRLIASFIQANPAITIELAYSNRPLHMIEEGCDVGIIAGNLTDDSVVARPLGRIRRFLAASPAFVGRQKTPHSPNDIQRWPWMALSNPQFGSSKEVLLSSATRGDLNLGINPVMIAEGVTSLHEAVRMGLGVAVLPEWLIEEDLVLGRLVRVLPKWHANELPAHIIFPVQRHLPRRVRTFIDFAESYMATVLKSEK